MVYFIRLWLETQELLGSNPGRVGCLSSRLGIYSVPNCSKVLVVQ